MDTIRALVRPVVTLAFTGGVLWGFIARKIEPTEFLVIATVCIYWWFQSRKPGPPPTGGANAA